MPIEPDDKELARGTALVVARVYPLDKARQVCDALIEGAELSGDMDSARLWRLVAKELQDMPGWVN